MCARDDQPDDIQQAFVYMKKIGVDFVLCIINKSSADVKRACTHAPVGFDFVQDL
jgi:hypothetical protein